MSDKLNKLLMQVAREHPQALIYPITVTSNTASSTRRHAARLIINEMRIISEQLVDEANLVSREMMKVGGCGWVGVGGWVWVDGRVCVCGCVRVCKCAWVGV